MHFGGGSGLCFEIEAFYPKSTSLTSCSWFTGQSCFRHYTKITEQYNEIKRISQFISSSIATSQAEWHVRLMMALIPVARKSKVKIRACCSSGTTAEALRVSRARRAERARKLLVFQKQYGGYWHPYSGVKYVKINTFSVSNCKQAQAIRKIIQEMKQHKKSWNNVGCEGSLIIIVCFIDSQLGLLCGIKGDNERRQTGAESEDHSAESMKRIDQCEKK